MSNMSSSQHDRPIKILFLNHVSTVGGAERSLIDIVRTLDGSRFEAFVGIPAGGNLPQELSSSNSKIVNFPMRRLVRSANPVRLFSYLANVMSVSRQIKSMIVHEGIDIVHSNSTTAHLYGGLAARMTNRPCIWHCRDLVRLGILGKFLGSMATVIVAISKAVADEVSKHGHADKLRVIANGIDVSAFSGTTRKDAIRAELEISPASTVVAMAAQLTPWKNHSLFLRAAGIAAPQLPHARFVVIGGNLFGDNPAYEQQLREMVKDLHLEQSVVFTGHRNDFADLLSEVDIFVHPASQEPFGRVVAEAMASSKPVVAVNSGGIPELITDAENGLIVPPDNPEEMARAIVRIARDPALAAHLGRNARQHVLDKFTRETLSKHLERLYVEVSSGNSPATKPHGIGYVLGEFPSLSETFVLREIVALEKLGACLRLYSLNRPSSSKTHAQAKLLANRVRYPAPWLSWAMFTSQWSSFFAWPGAYFRMALQSITHGPRAFRNFLIAAHFAADARVSHVGHIHAHFAFTPADVGLLMAKLMQCKCSISAHARDIYTQDPSALAKKVQEASLVVACTEHGQRYLKKITPHLPETHIALVHHGIDAGLFTPGQSNKRSILAVGRLEEKKGFTDLLKACGLMTLSGRDFSCTIVGSGALENELEEEILRSGSAGNVILFGEATQEELLELYGQAQVLVVPSVLAADGDRDGIPNVILEAMAMKLPVVATTTGAIKEAVTDQENGLLVPPGEPKALATAIVSLMEDADLRSRLGEAGRQRVVRQFDLERNAAQMLELFTHFVGNPDGAKP